MTHAEQHPVERALRSAFHRGDTVVAAVSGGGDSMAMLHALYTLASERDLKIIAAHFDHQLRPDSNLDSDFVVRVAHGWGLRIAPGRGDVRTHAHRTGQSAEAAARELRYAFLERIADESNADAIVTAHTRNDQVETILMRIMRGAGARGCRGIHVRRGRIVRPLLSVTRADTHEYCRVQGVPFVDDPSNASRDYERNRVRHDVLPELRAYFPGIDNALLRIAENADAEFQRAEAATARRLSAFLQPETTNRWLLEIEAFKGLDDPDDRSHLVSAAFDAMNARDYVTREHHEQVLALVDAAPGTWATLHGGLQVRREHDGLVFVRYRRAPSCDIVVHTLKAPGSLDLDGWHMEACRVEAPAAPQLSNSGGDVAYIPCDDMMVVRYPREGDRMQPFGMEGHKKLSDIFIDRKIPKRKRASTPVIEVDGEIVWIVGVAASEKSRINAGARNVVQLTATRSHV
jgi:tRNA(Ile)-lysidine synthase